eukprot:TRINITY_DN84405_c0_g1_i1.p1 TRINITY_DN84405_c0_g1~~TRINITY_DN84405_c0_g1_i1.p1  ORF type:complete len:109 (+),score=32.96 TRINITY_DN84405_c0_g1_i1:89-415(+)
MRQRGAAANGSNKEGAGEKAVAKGKKAAAEEPELSLGGRICLGVLILLMLIPMGLLFYMPPWMEQALGEFERDMFSPNAELDGIAASVMEEESGHALASESEEVELDS